MQAAEGGNVDQVRALLQSGVDLNEARGSGHTALMLAAGRDYLEIVRTLLRAGANPTPSSSAAMACMVGRGWLR